MFTSISSDHLLLFILTLPLLGGIACFSFPFKKTVAHSFVACVSIVLVINLMNMWRFSAVGGTAFLWIAEPIESISISFVTDSCTVLFATCISFLWFISSVYSYAYLPLHRLPHQHHFQGWMCLSIAATLGVVFAANLVTLVICYELLTFFTYPLVVFGGGKEKEKAGVTYLLYLLGSSLLLLFPATVITLFYAGTHYFEYGGALQPNALPSSLVIILSLLFLFGIAKTAIMPFHRWLPSAMVAPIPVSALLHAVAVVNAGCIALFRIYNYELGNATLKAAYATLGGNYLVVIPIITMIGGALYAAKQKKLKLLLAYSTISQLSYAVLAFSLFTAPAALAGALQLCVHSFAKITLFLATGAIMTQHGDDRIERCDGLGRTMPLTAAAFTISALSLLGLPPLGGFIAKYYLLQAAWEQNAISVALALITVTVINGWYLLPLLYRMYCMAPIHDNIAHAKQQELPGGMKKALFLGIALIVLFWPLSHHYIALITRTLG